MFRGLTEKWKIAISTGSHIMKLKDAELDIIMKTLSIIRNSFN